VRIVPGVTFEGIRSVWEVMREVHSGGVRREEIRSRE
jgi:hypothetical protein